MPQRVTRERLPQIVQELNRRELAPRDQPPTLVPGPRGILTVPWLKFPLYQNVMHRISGVAYSVSMWAFHRAHSADAFLASVGVYS